MLLRWTLKEKSNSGPISLDFSLVLLCFMVHGIFFYEKQMLPLWSNLWHLTEYWRFFRWIQARANANDAPRLPEVLIGNCLLTLQLHQTLKVIMCHCRLHSLPPRVATESILQQVNMTQVSFNYSMLDFYLDDCRAQSSSKLKSLYVLKAALLANFTLWSSPCKQANTPNCDGEHCRDHSCGT